MASGAPLEGPGKADKLIRDLDPFASLALAYAAIAGVWLFVSGLIAGNLVFGVLLRVTPLVDANNVPVERGRATVACRLIPGRSCPLARMLVEAHRAQSGCEDPGASRSARDHGTRGERVRWTPRRLRIATRPGVRPGESRFLIAGAS